MSMRNSFSPPPAINRLQQKEEAKFICTACGKDRNCDCNAPAREKLAELVEQRRAARRTYDEKKREQKQQSSDIRNEEAATKPRENPMQTEQTATVDEGKILNHLATEIIKEGYETLRERFHYDKQTMTRLARARDNLRNYTIEF